MDTLGGGGHGNLSAQLINVGCREGMCRALETEISGQCPLDSGYPGPVVLVQGGYIEFCLSGLAPIEDPIRVAAWPGQVKQVDQVYQPGPPRAYSLGLSYLTVGPGDRHYLERKVPWKF